MYMKFNNYVGCSMFMFGTNQLFFNQVSWKDYKSKNQILDNHDNVQRKQW